MTNTEIDRIINRIKKARAYAEKKLNDPNVSDEEREDAEFLKDDIEKLIEDMCYYTASVFDDNYKKYDFQQMVAQYTEVDDFQRASEEIEKRRKSNHDRLILQIKVVDNACKREGLEEIYGELPDKYRRDTSGLMGDDNRKKPGVVETRHAIADWCFEFVLSATVGMYMELDELNFEKNEGDYKTVSEDFKYKRGGKKAAKEMIMKLSDPDL